MICNHFHNLFACEGQNVVYNHILLAKKILAKMKGDILNEKRKKDC